MNALVPSRRAGRLAALVTAATLLAAPLAVVPAVTSAPSAAAATATHVTIKKIGTKTAPYAKRATVRPNVTKSGRVAVKSARLSVKHDGKKIAKEVRTVHLKAGTYEVATKVTYRTYTVKSSGAKAWSTYKVKSHAQKLVVKQGKKPSRTTPVSAYSCPSWAPIKGNHSSSGEWIYHVPSGAFYDRTAPEECFTTEAAARHAGYRKSKL